MTDAQGSSVRKTQLTIDEKCLIERSKMEMGHSENVVAAWFRRQMGKEIHRLVVGKCVRVPKRSRSSHQHSPSPLDSDHEDSQLTNQAELWREIAASNTNTKAILAFSKAIQNSFWPTDLIVRNI